MVPDFSFGETPRPNQLHLNRRESACPPGICRLFRWYLPSPLMPPSSAAGGQRARRPARTAGAWRLGIVNRVERLEVLEDALTHPAMLGVVGMPSVPVEIEIFEGHLARHCVDFKFQLFGNRHRKGRRQRADQLAL